MKTPLIGICRHRLATDGKGVTTLVAFHGCPLRCKYCLNAQCLREDGVWRRMDALDILNEVIVDDLYFKATAGGVTFGGGEPLLRSDEIVSFCKLMPAEWHISVETSLNVSLEKLQAVITGCGSLRSSLLYRCERYESRDLSPLYLYQQ